MTTLETVMVSRKTPRDGKLEISAATADSLGGEGARVQVSITPAIEIATVVAMPCACKTGAQHVVHHFLQADVLRELPPESSVTLELLQTSQGPVVMINR